MFNIIKSILKCKPTSCAPGNTPSTTEQSRSHRQEPFHVPPHPRHGAPQAQCAFLLPHHVAFVPENPASQCSSPRGLSRDVTSPCVRAFVRLCTSFLYGHRICPYFLGAPPLLWAQRREGPSSTCACAAATWTFPPLLFCACCRWRRTVDTRLLQSISDTTEGKSCSDQAMALSGRHITVLHSMSRN